MLGPHRLIKWVAAGDGTPRPPASRGTRLGLAGRDAEGHRHLLHWQRQRDGSDPLAATLGWSKTSPTRLSVLSAPQEILGAAGGWCKPGRVSRAGQGVLPPTQQTTASTGDNFRSFALIKVI